MVASLVFDINFCAFHCHISSNSEVVVSFRYNSKIFTLLRREDCSYERDLLSFLVFGNSDEGVQM